MMTNQNEPTGRAYIVLMGEGGNVIETRDLTLDSNVSPEAEREYALARAMGIEHDAKQEVEGPFYTKWIVR